MTNTIEKKLEILEKHGRCTVKNVTTYLALQEAAAAKGIYTSGKQMDEGIRVIASQFKI